MRKLLPNCLWLVFTLSPANAQWENTTFITTSTPAPFVSVGALPSIPGVNCCGIALTDFANANEVNSRFAVNAQAFAQVHQQISRLAELTAVAAALRDAIPNPGDRFALRINAAGFSGQAAGAIGFSYNVTDSARVSVNYGQGRSQGIVSGGMNFSFR